MHFKYFKYFKYYNFTIYLLSPSKKIAMKCIHIEYSHSSDNKSPYSRRLLLRRAGLHDQEVRGGLCLHLDGPGPLPRLCPAVDRVHYCPALQRSNTGEQGALQ